MLSLSVESVIVSRDRGRGRERGRGRFEGAGRGRDGGGRGGRFDGGGRGGRFEGGGKALKLQYRQLLSVYQRPDNPDKQPRIVRVPGRSQDIGWASFYCRSAVLVSNRAVTQSW